MSTHALNALIVACNDGIDAQRSTADFIASKLRRELLEDSMQRRSSFVVELSQLVADGGGTAATGGSLLEGVRAALHRLNVLVVGNNAGDAYSILERVEGRAENAYARTLRGKLSDRTRAVVERHLAEIRVDRAEFRRLSVGGEPGTA